MYSFRESFDVKILAWAKGQRFGWKMLLAVRIKLIGLGRRPTKISGPWCMVYSRFSGVDCPSPLHLQLISLPSEESLYSHPFLFSMINSLHKTKVIHHSKHYFALSYCWFYCYFIISELNVFLWGRNGRRRKKYLRANNPSKTCHQKTKTPKLLHFTLTATWMFVLNFMAISLMQSIKLISFVLWGPYMTHGHQSNGGWDIKDWINRLTSPSLQYITPLAWLIRNL